MSAIIYFINKYWPFILAAGIAVIIIVVLFVVYNKGEKAGASGVTNAVQADTIKKTDAARISKEKTDAEVINTPYNDRVDSLK